MSLLTDLHLQDSNSAIVKKVFRLRQIYSRLSPNLLLSTVGNNGRQRERLNGSRRTSIDREGLQLIEKDFNGSRKIQWINKDFNG